MTDSDKQVIHVGRSSTYSILAGHKVFTRTSRISLDTRCSQEHLASRWTQDVHKNIFMDAFVELSEFHH